jgi:hypothetical protein
MTMAAAITADAMVIISPNVVMSDLVGYIYN